MMKKTVKMKIVKKKRPLSMKMTRRWTTTAFKEKKITKD